MANRRIIGSQDFVLDMFKHIDKNNDGFVSKEEIQEYAQKYGASLLGPKGQALFEKIDVSNDKKISIEGIKFEFINLSFFFTWILFISEVMAYYEKATAKWNKAIFCLW